MSAFQNVDKTLNQRKKVGFETPQSNLQNNNLRYIFKKRNFNFIEAVKK